MQSVDTLIQADWIIPVEPAGKIYEHHCIAIQNGRIVSILDKKTAQQQVRAKEIVNLPGHALMPGFVNAHTHTPMSLFRGLADDLPLMDWLQNHIWPAEAQFVNEEFTYQGSLLAIAEMIKSGTTCFNDMYFFPNQTARASKETGIRAMLGLVVLDFPTPWAQTADEYLQKGLKVRDEWRHEELITTCLAPHAPYSVSDGPLKQLVTLTDELDTPLHMHIHETAHEIDESVARYGIRPLERLSQLGLIGPRLLAVHMTQLLDDEIKALAARGAHVVHCPESNLKLASGFCPVQKLMEVGVNIAIGTDGPASNNNLDMLTEMRAAALLAKGVSGHATSVPAQTALQMATLNGAKAIGLDQHIGSLTEGKAADCIAIDLSDINTQPVYDPISQIVYASHPHQIKHVWVAGKALLKDGKLCTLNETASLQHAKTWRHKIKQALTQ